MKKLMVIFVVLGIASISSAGLVDDIQLVLDGGTVSVVGDAASPLVNATGFGLYVNTGGNVSEPHTLNVNAGDAGDITQWEGYNGVDMTVYQADSAVGSVESGEWATFAYDGAAGDVFDLFDYTQSYDNPVGTVNVVPEPMTMALLGFGGLFLRRRK